MYDGRVMPRHLALLVAIVVCALGALASPADAKPKRKVRIESDPSGATVYVNSKKSRPRGKTPLTLDLPIGEVTLIVEKNGYQPHIESVSVTAAKGKAAKKPQPLSFTLDKAGSTIRLKGVSRGATVTLDGNAVSATDKIEAEPGAHELVVKQPGKEPFDQWVEISAGDEKVVDVKAGGGGAVASGGGGGGGGDGGDENPLATAGGGAGSGDSGGGGAAAVETHQEPGGRAPHPWYGTLGASYEAGWRRFTYSGLTKGTQKPFEGNGIGMITFWGELAPWRASSGAHAIWPLSIVGSFGVGFPVTASDPTGKTANTFWRTTEVGLRWHWNVTHELGLDFEGGWARLLYTFRDDMDGLIDTIPDVDYQSVRLGLRGVARLGAGRLWVAGEDRIILSAGEETNRFTGASAQGLGARVGFDVPLMSGRLIIRVEGNLSRYTWTFHSVMTDTNVADGATDTLFGFNAGLGGSY
jgi:PEGA domain